MIELYVLLTLGAIGYIANAANTKKVFSPDHITVRKADVPSMKNAYDSRHFENVQNKITQKATRMYQKSLDPVQSAVIDKNFGMDKQRHLDKKVRSLTGEYINPQDFTHNNMIPFFGGRMKQNMDDGANSTIMENYTGVTTDYKQKCEVGSMFEMTKGFTNINGMENKDDFFKDRMSAPRVRNNELPFNQVKVGPGVDSGYGDKPSGGFHAMNVQDVVMPKCVDELRVANKPKVTYEGRMVDGQQGSVRGEMGKMNKNRVNTYFEQSHDHLFRTTGAFLKPSEIPEFNVKATHRLDTTKEYIGTASANQKARTLDPAVRAAFKSQHGEFGLRNARLVDKGKGSKDDYGKSNILVYANERDVTTTKVHQGNVTSLIKAIVAPLLDILQTTKKDEFIDNPRHFGNMSIQIPDKGPINDPNDVARTTIKETTIHDAILGNLRGAEKGTVHDPNDIARTTTKETTVHEAVMANLRGKDKLTIYDPNDVARTTIKETLIHDDTGTGTITGPKQMFVYDPDEIAKTTLRETMDPMETVLNLSGGAKKGTIYDPNDTARTTMRETLEDMVRDGNLDGLEGMGDYNTTEYDAKRTQKQFLSDNDYYGSAALDLGMGYETNVHEAKNTQKQFLSDHDYYGNAEASTDKKQMSYDDMYNAYISATKESVLGGREPTKTGKKVASGGESVNMKFKKVQCDVYAERGTMNIDKIQNELPTLEDQSLTRMKKEYGADNRLDPSLLKAYMENPYTQPLHSIA